eukprot:350893-Pleurochrysis_carterae.AAC.2
MALRALQSLARAPAADGIDDGQASGGLPVNPPAHGSFKVQPPAAAPSGADASLHKRILAARASCPAGVFAVRLPGSRVAVVPLQALLFPLFPCTLRSRLGRETPYFLGICNTPAPI